MILIDSNIFMYAAGRPHPNKTPSADLLERVAAGAVDAAVDGEVLQEILHRYRSIGRWQEGRQVYDLARHIVPTVVPVTADVLDQARLLLDEYPSLMARDALHASASRHCRAEAICSYDRDFDRIRGLRRREPPQIR